MRPSQIGRTHEPRRRAIQAPEGVVDNRHAPEREAGEGSEGVTEPTFSLVLTQGQAEQLFRLVGLGELAIAEHYRTGWLPGGQGDATLMQTYVKAMAGAPSLERPFGQLREWVRQQERGKHEP
jgi:hypothetical protein